MKGKETLIQQFITNDAPYFIIVDGRNNCIGKNDKQEDTGVAAERLNGFLSSLDPDSKSRYSIYCYEQLPDGKLKGKAKDIMSMGDHDYLLTFTPYEPKSVDDESRVNWRVQQELEKKEMREKLDRIEAALMTRQIAEQAEDEEDVIEETEPKSIVGALMDNPQIQGALAGALSAWLTKVITPGGGPMAVAGLPENTSADAADYDRLNKALETLARHDDALIVHLETLAAMAEKDTAKFKFLLNML